MFAFLFAATLSPADVPRASFGQTAALDFAALSLDDAARFGGQVVLVRIRFDSTVGECGNYTLYDCVSRDSVARTVWFLEDPEAGGAKLPAGMEVTARLVVVRHPGRRVGGTWFPAFTELRLMDARRVR